jgi:hypothetical protein
MTRHVARRWADTRRRATAVYIVISKALQKVSQNKGLRMAKRDPDSYSDKETERRATDALRRALTTPYKPQADMVGKVGRNAPKPKSKRQVKKRK